MQAMIKILAITYLVCVVFPTKPQMTHTKLGHQIKQRDKAEKNKSDQNKLLTSSELRGSQLLARKQVKNSALNKIMPKKSEVSMLKSA